MKKTKLLSLLLAGVMALSLARPALAEGEITTLTFDQAQGAYQVWEPQGAYQVLEPQGSQYAEAQAYVLEKGIMTGTDKGFEPDLAVTRGQLIQTLYNLEGRPSYTQETPPEGHLAGLAWASATGRFYQSVERQWYEDCAKWAYGVGLTKGDENYDFGGERVLTRAELLTVLHRYAQFKEMDTSWAEDTNILSYDDAFTIPEWAMGAFQWACAYGIYDTSIHQDPSVLGWGDTVDRGELALMLMNFDQLGEQGSDPLSLWTETAPAKAALVEYMAAITDPDSEDYIPVRDRIAVFDLDGTLYNETDPNYFDYTLLKYRVLEDPDYKDRASDFEREVAHQIKEQNETGKSFPGLEVNHGKAVASAFSGMTLDELNDYIQAFKQNPMPSYEGMTRGEAFYRPMIQVVDYLRANDFTVYIVSGTDRFLVRGIVEGSPLDIPPGQIIGSDETLVAPDQGATDGLEYVFDSDDKLVLGGDFLIKNLKMNKVTVIMQEIGQQPVLAFGNSGGDASMANFVVYNNPHRSAAFMLCCDDLVRENGNETKAQSMKDSCAKNGWVAVSMRDDWATIYGEGVTRK